MMIRVKALKFTFCGGSGRNIDDVFDAEERDFNPTVMERVDAKSAVTKPPAINKSDDKLPPSGGMDKPKPSNEIDNFIETVDPEGYDRFPGKSKDATGTAKMYANDKPRKKNK